MKEIVLGIDIGGTNVCYGVVDRNGTPLFVNTTKTSSWSSVDTLLEHIKEDVTKEFNAKIKGVGIGVPNGNYFKGTIESAPNLPWKGLIKIKDIAENIFQSKAYIDNDANLAAIGEKIFGEAKGLDNFVVITLGTGLGSGIFLENRLIRGHWGLAGELGHITVSDITGTFRPEARICACGKKDCLETYVSATGLKRTFLHLLAKNPELSILSKHSLDELNSKLIYEAAIEGDPIAIESFKLTGKILGAKLADFVLISSVSHIFLSGGLAKALNLFLSETEHTLEQNLIPSYMEKKITIKNSKVNLQWEQCNECSGEAGVGILGSAGLVYLENN